MALIHLEGFEGLAPEFISTGTNPNYEVCRDYLMSIYSGRFYIGTNSFHIRRGQDGRSACLGTGIAAGGQFMWIGKYFTPVSGSVIVGLRIKFSATSKNGTEILRLTGDSNPTASEAKLVMTLTNQIQIQKGGAGSIVATSAANVFDDDSWHYLEYKTDFNTSGTGSYEVKMDGVSILSGTASTAVTSGSIPAGLQIYSPDNATDSQAEIMMYDDWYICDTTGTENNDFLGPINIYHRPLKATASDVDWANYAGESIVSSLNPNPDKDDSTGIEAIDTSGQAVNFTIEEYNGPGGDIVGVKVDTRVKTKDGFQAIGITHYVESGGISETVDMPKVFDNTHWTGYTSVYGTDPNTNTLWTASGVNEAYYGIEVT